MSKLEHQSRAGERKASPAVFHMVRAINRRSIRIQESNYTREIVDELLFQLDPESDLWAQIRFNRDQRDEVMTGQQIDLEIWERFMRGQGFVTASEIPIETTPPSGDPVQPQRGNGQAIPSNGYKPPSPGQIKLINMIRTDSQNAEKEWIEICGQLGVDKPEQLSNPNASKAIDRLKAAAGWPANPQQGRQQSL